MISVFVTLYQYLEKDKNYYKIKKQKNKKLRE